MIQIKLENPPGSILTTRLFEPGQNLRVGAHVTGPLDVPDILSPVRFELYNGTDYFTDVQTSLLGDAWVDWVLPNEITAATIKVTAFHPIGGPEIMEIPIGIGKEPSAVGEFMSMTWVWVIGGIAVGLLALYVFTRASGLHKVTSAAASRLSNPTHKRLRRQSYV